MSCAICETRKEKRFCPAIHGRICPVCCGTSREVTLDCPSDCVYLQQARQNEKPRPWEELKDVELFANVEVPQPWYYEHEPLIAGLLFAVATVARGDRHANDRDMLNALTAITRSYQTRVNSGLLYEETAAGLLQQNLANEIHKMIVEYRAVEEKNVGYFTLKDGDVLRALTVIVRLGQGRTNGRPRSRAFLDFLFARFPEQSPTASPAAGSKLIL